MTTDEPVTDPDLRPAAPPTAATAANAIAAAGGAGPAGAATAHALGGWLRQGAASALLRAPQWDGLFATPGVCAALLLLAFGLELAIERLAIAGSASFYAPSLHSGWLSLLAMAGASWLAVPRTADAEVAAAAVDPTATAALQSPNATALFALLVAQSAALTVLLAPLSLLFTREPALLQRMLGGTGVWAVWLAATAWVVAAQVRLVWRVGTARSRAAAAALLVAVVALTHAVRPIDHWYAEPEPAAAEAPQPLRLTQQVIERQPQLLAEQLRGLAPQRAGSVDVYALTFAPYADEDVFRRESELVAGVMQQRFGAAGRTLQLVNHRDTQLQFAWATPLNLQRAIRDIARQMDRDEDVLFIHLTSHGAQSGVLAANFEPLAVDPVTPQLLAGWLNEAGIRWRVVSISACYAGSWVGPLASPGTLVMTAADADHTSYGCGRRSELTFFGRALYDEQLRRSWSFEQAHAAARIAIEQREREAGKDDGYSNPQISVGVDIRPVLARLEQQRAAARR